MSIGNRNFHVEYTYNGRQYIASAHIMRETAEYVARTRYHATDMPNATVVECNEECGDGRGCEVFVS